MPHSALSPEQRSIEFVPLSERHGSPRSLFTLWFGGNLQVTSIAGGAIAIYLGLPLPWAILSAIIGHAVGAIFMALHSAQGPILGIPQMIQSRAQFGFYGAILPIVLVILMYLGFSASTVVPGGAAMASLTHLPVDASMVLVAVLTVALTIFGYRYLHAAERWLTLIGGLAFAFLSIMLLVDNDIAKVWTFNGFAWPPFILSVAISATWQLTYGPYVADYSRYLPANTPVRASFWWTYFGTVLSCIWMFSFGAIAEAVAPKAFDGGSVDFIVGPAGVLTPLFLVIVVAGVVAVNALNLYGAFMSVTTTMNALFKVRVTRITRLVVTVVVAVLALLIAIVGRDNFLGNFTNFILLLAYFLIPWTSINLADFYLIRKEKYEIAEIYKPKGEYGGIDWRAMVAYVFGIAIEIPFISSEFFTGPIATALGGADVSWILGIFAGGAAYAFLMRRFPNRRRYPSAASNAPIVEPAATDQVPDTAVL